MAGFYVHVPFCRKACYYCDFHFVATLKYKDEMLKAMLKEIELRSEEWKNYEFSTLYFGGGTPSVLSVAELELLLKAIFTNYRFSKELEITLEANPDDLTLEYLTGLKAHTPINRFSIGVQSFHDNDLKLMNRRHDGKQAIESIENAYRVGFINLNADLIYGIPKADIHRWRKNLQIFLDLEIPHLSAYHLMFEPKTIFSHFLNKNKLQPSTEQSSSEQYNMLLELMQENGYERYEISNFACNGHYSKHNTAYWFGAPYLGIGPSAHSFQDNERRWNVSNNSEYTLCLKNQEPGYYSTEQLTMQNRHNEYIMTSLRTKWGVDLKFFKDSFGEDSYKRFIAKAKTYINSGDMQQIRSAISLTEKGFFKSDYVMSDFFEVG